MTRRFKSGSPFTPTGPSIEWQPSCLTSCVDVVDLEEKGGRRVSRKFLGTLFVLLAVGAADLHCAFGVNLAWDPSSDTNVTGYVIYYGTNSGSYARNFVDPTGGYTWHVDVGNQTTATLSNLPPGVTYHFVVTAYTAGGVESLPSNEVKYLAPGMLRLTVGAGGQKQVNFVSETGKTYYLQTSSNLAQWVTIQQLQPGSNAWAYFLDPVAAFLPARFYRILASP